MNATRKICSLFLNSHRRCNLSSRCVSTVDSTQAFLRLQSDEVALKKAAETRGQFLLYHEKGLRPLISADGNPAWVTYTELCSRINDDIEKVRPLVLLSLSSEETPYFAVRCNSVEDSFKDISSYFSDLRIGLFRLKDGWSYNLVSKGWSILKWHEKTQFCRTCGSNDLQRRLDGHSIRCNDCSTVNYPTTSPVGIVLITDVFNSKILLVHLTRHPTRVFSCVAGYVDAGESIEDCVKREVAEEVGLEVEDIEYKGSQHWPFPLGSLMIGFVARIKGSESFRIKPNEVKEAKWLYPEEIIAAFKNGLGSDFILPPPGTIARTLIEDWITTFHGGGHLN